MRSPIFVIRILALVVGSFVIQIFGQSDETNCRMKRGILPPGTEFAEAARSNPCFFTDPISKFSLSYPNDWEPVQKSHAVTRFKISKLGSLDLVDFSVVVTQPEILHSMSSDAFVKQYVEDPKLVEQMVQVGAKTMGGSANLLASGRTTLAGKPSFYMKSEATYILVGEPMKFIIYQEVMLVDGNSYALTFRSPAGKYGDAYRDLVLMKNSFALR